MKGLKISETLTLPLEVVTLTQAILAKKGSGKSYTSAVEAEEMLRGGQQVVIIDPTGVWWGLKSSADGTAAGFPIAILGGEHADVALDEHAGEIVAGAIVEQGFSAILDLSLFRKGAMNRFMAAFLEKLYHANRNSMHLVVDEADLFAPQKPFGEEARTLGAMQDVVRRGRVRGIGISMITQRPQVLNKDVLSQADVLCALRMNHPRELAAVAEWVNVHGDPKQAKAMIESLPALPIGEAWFWIPGMDIFERAKIRRRETFDSSATPKPGQKIAQPKVLAPIDIQALGAQIAATAEEQKANAPDALKRRIRELEAELAKKPAAIGEQIDRKKLLEAQQEEVQRIVSSVVRPLVVKTVGGNLKLIIDRMESLIGILKGNMEELDSDAGWTLNYLSGDAKSAIERCVVPASSLETLRGDPDAKRRFLDGASYIHQAADAPPPPKRPAALREGKKLRAGAERMLAVLVQWYPHGRTEAQLAAQVQMKRTGGTFGAYKSDLRTNEYVEQNGGLFYATKVGVEYFGGNVPEAPRSTGEVVDLWGSKLRAGARKMLDELVRQRGRSITRDDLGHRVEMEPSGGTFGAYLSDLKTADLIVVDGQMIAANKETLFL